MSLYLEEEGEITLPFETKEVADLVVEAALEYEGCPYEAEINLLLTTDDPPDERGVSSDRPGNGCFVVSDAGI